MNSAATVGIVVAIAFAGCLDGTIFDGGSMVDPRDYLRDTQYTRWVIEVDHSPGNAPPQAVLDSLRAHIAPLVHKSSVEIRIDETDLPTQQTWSTSELESLDATHQGTKTKGSTVVTHLMYLDGTFETENGGAVLGVTIGYDLVAIFPGVARASCTLTSLPPCPYSQAEILEAVSIHEFGHALGLVNRHAEGRKAPVPMVTPHEDPEHPGHSDNQRSVMYWAVETTAFLTLVQGGIPTEFDTDDRADLRAAGGR